MLIERAHAQKLFQRGLFHLLHVGKAHVIVHQRENLIGFSNEEADQILALVDNHMRFADVQKMKESTLKKFLRMRAFDEHLELHRMDCLSSNGITESYEFVHEKLQTLPPEAIRPRALITGQDLIDAGYEPGPRFKEILGALEDAQLEGRL